MSSRKRKCGVSRTALTMALVCGLAGITGQAYAAQDTAVDAQASGDTDGTTVVVVGSRKALKTAQELKKSADTVVDSITATDIGAFPDKSVAEALQRVPGVTVMRSVAGGDVMHFPAEPSGVLIRGLQQVKAEFNGRDIFSAGSASGLSWEDISPEMLAGVDVYKNLTADILEGGIAGTVNLRTRLPFDQKGQLISATIEGDYGDLSKKWTPSGSALYSNRWRTELGDFGFLGDVAYSEIETTSQGAILPRMMPFAAGVYSDQMNFIPSGISYNNTVYDRTRKGISLAGQWASTDNHFKATLQYNKSTYENTWNEDQLLSYWAWVDPATTNQSTVWTNGSLIGPPDAPGLGINEAGGGTPFTFGNNGLFQNGVITSSAGDWGYGSIADWSTGEYAVGSTDQFGTYDQYGIDKPIYQPCLKSDVTHANQPCRIAPAVNLATRYSTESRTVEDTALNFIWTPTDRLKFTFDAQHVLSVNTHYDITYRNGTYANLAVDLTGDLPKLSFELPSGYNVVGDDPMSDYRNYFNESIMDHLEDSKATMNAFRIDGAYAFDGPWLSEIRAGVRTSERDQLNQWSAYNWQSISSNWGANPADSFHLDAPATATFAGYPGTYWQTTSFGTDGLLKGLIGQNQFVTINPDYLKDINLMEQTFGMTAQSQGGTKTPSSNWDPICMRAANIAGSCFQPGEILNVNLKQDSAYVMLKFGGPDATLFGSGITLSGNVGVRYVQTNLTSIGATNFAVAFTPDEMNCQPLTPEQIAALAPGQYAISPGCLGANSLDDQAFSNGGYASSTVKTKHTYTLPSLNLKFTLPENWVVRFAASRGMSMPDIGLLKNYTTLQRSYVPQSAITQGNPSIVLDSAGNPVSYIYGYSGSTGNPRLRAIQADQFDLTVEHYFADVGSFSFDIFTKKFYDYIQNGTFVVPMTNNGVTRDVVVNGPVNGEGASVKGFEVAYQRYFTFLPAPFDGLGIQANYTHLHNEGVKNANLTLDTADGSTITRSAQDGMINAGRLEQLSDDSYNLIVMYDKGPFGARVAYNWRSKYVNSVNDCCIGFPVWNAAEGFLDGSLRYALNSHTEIDLQGTNLLDTRPKIFQEVLGPTAANPDQAPLFLPAGTFAFDRRFQLSVRFKY